MNLYHVTKFSPYFPLTLHCFYTRIGSFMPGLSIRIVLNCFYLHTAISRKVVGKNVHATIPKGNMGHDQHAAPDTAAVESSIAAFL